MQGLLDVVEVPLKPPAGGVQAAGHAHGLPELVGVGDVQVAGLGHESGDLPAPGVVVGHEGRVQAELAGQAQPGGLSVTVDDLLGAHAGVAVDVLLAVHGEVARQVRQPLLERVEARDVRLAATQRLRDVVEDLGVHVLDELGVEGADLVDRVELVDHALGVAAHDHVELLDVLDVDRLPQLGSRLGQVVDRLEDAPEGGGEGPVEVDVAQHDPGVGAPDLDVRDPIARAGGDAPLLGGALDVLGRVVGLVDVRLEGVVREVVVGGADEGVRQDVSHQPQGAVVVA